MISAVDGLSPYHMINKTKKNWQSWWFKNDIGAGNVVPWVESWERKEDPEGAGDSWEGPTENVIVQW